MSKSKKRTCSNVVYVPPPPPPPIPPPLQRSLDDVRGPLPELPKERNSSLPVNTNR